MAKSQTLEDHFEKLETLVAQLEGGSLSLDEAFKLYKEGMKLVHNCSTQLDKVEKQIIVLNNEEEDPSDGI